MPNPTPSRELIEAVAVTAELCGRTFSEPAARVFVADLGRFPEQAVIAALARCRREVKGILTVQDVVSRIDDGRPGVEEAWAMMSIAESQSVVWTEDMALAFGAAQPLVARSDFIGARMAFKEAYTKTVTLARDAGAPVRWTVSLGHDRHSRKAVLHQAVVAGRLTLEQARDHVPDLEAPAVAPALEAHITRALAQ